MPSSSHETDLFERDPLIGFAVLTPGGSVLRASKTLRSFLEASFGSPSTALEDWAADPPALSGELKRHKAHEDQFELLADLRNMRGARQRARMEFRVLRAGGEEFLCAVTVRREPRPVPPARAPLAQTDPQTGLASREQLTARIYERGLLAAAHGEFGLCLISLGAAAGIRDITRPREVVDALVRAAADQISAVVPAAHAARLASTQLLVYVPAAADTERVAAALLATLSSPLSVQGMRIKLAPVVATARCPRNGRTLPALLDALEAVLPAVQRTGELVPATRLEHDPSVEERREGTREMIVETIRQGAPRLQLTPVIDVASGTITAFEVNVQLRRLIGLTDLVRSPLDYLDRDEEADLVTEWLLAQALPICQRMYAANHVHFGLRMVGAQFFSGVLPEMLQGAIARHGCKPDQLSLIVPVGLLWRDAERFEMRAAALGRLGVAVCVEGYRGLLPLEGLRSAGVSAAKLHPRLTADATSSRFGMDYLRELLARGRIEGVAMTAQGVASRGELSRLFELSCERAQGPYISRALPLDDAQAVLAGNRGVELRAPLPA